MSEKNMETNNELFFNDDSPIFKFINPNCNDKLLKMSGFDLQELIILIDEYYMNLRKCLGFEKYITFGLELEVENAKENKIQKKFNETILYKTWIIKHDGSLKDGIEINSPILRDKEVSWSCLDKVCKIIEPLASIKKNSGGHIHIGTQTLGSKRDSWLNFIKIWSVYENIIYRFVYGEFLTGRPSILKYAKPMTIELWNDYEVLKKENADLYTIISRIDQRRTQAVNFSNVIDNNCNNFRDGNTIEFRCPNGTLNSVIWQNNVNFLVKLLLYSRGTSFNDDLVEQRHKLNSDKFVDLKWYDELYIEQALELCDMIFKNNLDKIYFLKQYLKSFEVYKNNKKYSKTLSLTKK